jgi:hypothetical protein
MGNQIIKQPNGKYAVFSSVVDDFVFYNATPKDLIDYFAKHEVEKITQFVEETVKGIDKGTKPYFQFTMTWDEAVETARQVHGAKWQAPKIKLTQ